jgi:hypothetical protein
MRPLLVKQIQRLINVVQAVDLSERQWCAGNKCW